MKFVVEIDTKKFRTPEKLQEHLAGLKVWGKNGDTDIGVEVAPKVDTSRSGRFSAAVSQIEEGRSEIECLKDEMEQWRDSIPENLQGGEKYQQVESCCDELDSVLSEIPETLDEPEFPGMF